MSVPSPDDRDRVVDRLLRQTQGGAPPGPAPGPCVEADMLAAWSDGTLAASDIQALEVHVAGCTRCQALLATFARTDVPAVVEPAAESIWRRWRLAWVVPVATAATVTAIWVAVPEQDRAQVTAPATPEADLEATAETAEVPVQPRARAEAQAPGAEPQEERLDRALAQPAAAAAAEPIDRTSPAAPASAVATSADADASPARQRDSRESFADETAVVRGALPEVDAQNARRLATDSLQSAATSAPDARAVEIASPDSAVRWRITAAGLEHTTSAGADWEPVAGLAAGIVAGSAPSADVCWLVGAAGAVWLSTDGVAFERLPFPEPVELRDVTAMDERTATVTAADGRTWRTTDGGQTWE